MTVIDGGDEINESDDIELTIEANEPEGVSRVRKPLFHGLNRSDQMLVILQSRNMEISELFSEMQKLGSEFPKATMQSTLSRQKHLFETTDGKWRALRKPPYPFK